MQRESSLKLHCLPISRRPTLSSTVRLTRTSILGTERNGDLQHSSIRDRKSERRPTTEQPPLRVVDSPTYYRSSCECSRRPQCCEAISSTTRRSSSRGVTIIDAIIPVCNAKSPNMSVSTSKIYDQLPWAALPQELITTLVRSWCNQPSRHQRQSACRKCGLVDVDKNAVSQRSGRRRSGVAQPLCDLRLFGHDDRSHVARIVEHDPARCYQIDSFIG
jgi:hypothetical protein